MKTRCNGFIALAFSILSTMIFAEEDTRDPLEVFVGHSEYLFKLCGIRAQLDFVSNTSTLKTCQKEAKQETKASVKVIVAGFNGKLPSVNLVKNYYSTWLVGMDELSLLPSESMVSYQVRQQAKSNAIHENGVWMLVELQLK